MLGISKIVVLDGKTSPLEWSVGIIFGVAVLISLVARVFLIVESFLALRYLNDEVFQSVAWAHTWPHL